MKKSVLIFLTLMLLLCACAPKADDNSQSKSSNVSNGSLSQISSTASDESNSVSETKDEKATNIYVTYNTIGHYLPSEYEYPVKSVLYSGEWSEVDADCLCDFTIRFDSRVFYYHSECGTVSLDGKSKQLSASDMANLNNLFFALFDLLQDEDT